MRFALAEKAALRIQSMFRGHKARIGLTNQTGQPAQKEARQQTQKAPCVGRQHVFAPLLFFEIIKAFIRDQAFLGSLACPQFLRILEEVLLLLSAGFLGCSAIQEIY